MTKEQLIALGLGEELAIKVAGESKKELEGYVERAKYLELETEKNQLAESNKSLMRNLKSKYQICKKLKKLKTKSMLII